MLSTLVFCHVCVAASVPRTSPTARGTCDPDFYSVLEERAWMEAQREITQNSNLITRPDSVLTVSCFGGFMNHLGSYSGRAAADLNPFNTSSRGHFPGWPDESLDRPPGSGPLGIPNLLDAIAIAADPDGAFLEGAMTLRYETLYLASELLGSPEPYVTQGFYLYSLLELLVLDQLEDDVTTIVAQAVDAPYFLACGGSKDYYIEDNFPDFLLEDRAKTEAGPPAWTQVNAELGERIAYESYTYNCVEMNAVWKRAQCYDFATESLLDVSPPTGGPPPQVFHDAFYSLEQYTTNAAAGNDYRTNGRTGGDATMCPAPDGAAYHLPSFGDIACSLAVHGVSFALPAFIPPPTGGPTWASAALGADPDPGAAGAADPYTHFLDMVVGLISGGAGPLTGPVPTSPPAPLGGAPASTSYSCSSPIKTGVIVQNGTTSYVDAVCPTPGCWFNPPSSIPGNGTCSN